MKKFITRSKTQTQKLGELLAKELKGGEIICLSGDLGAGKTTFTQGLLKGLKIKGPHTSPTFVVMKRYRKTHIVNRKSICDVRDVYHIDAYRIGANDLLALGWKELVSDKENILIVEWAERVRKIIPKNAIWIRLKWLDENKREIELT